MEKEILISSLPPGSLIPKSGYYSIITQRGTVIGTTMYLKRGEPFPPSLDPIRYKFKGETQEKEQK